MGSYRTTLKSGKYKRQEPPIKTKLTLNLSATDGKIESVHLTLSQTTSFRVFQIGRVCRRQFQI